MHRDDALTCDGSTPFDVAIVGAGVNGAAVALALARAGVRVLLVDRGDIGGGTSQASTMLVWGGLLYLKDLELRTVLALCRDRDRLIAAAPDLVHACEVRHVALAPARSPLLVGAALHAYWLLGGRRRAPARRLTTFAEQALLARPNASAFAFEEGTLVESDARFVLQLARQASAHGAAVRTYREVTSMEFDRHARVWQVQTRDAGTGALETTAARFVVNTAGGWADGLNERAGIDTPWRHVLSRGVSLALPRDPRHRAHLVFDTADGNTLTLAPWGPVALWASTESLHPTMAEAGRIAPADVRYLLDEYNARFAEARGVDDIVALRVGVRPVPVARGQQVDARGLGLSRHHRLHLDPGRPWLTVFGGKLSGCHGLAAQAAALVHSRLRPAAGADARRASMLPPAGGPLTESFPGIPAPVVTPGWSAAHEFCRTLDDYLRRRTPIAQWLPRGGFGRHDEYAAAVTRVAHALHGGDGAAVARDLDRYRARVEADWCVLDALGSATAPTCAASPGVPA